MKNISKNKNNIMKTYNEGFIMTITIISLPLFIGCLIILTALIFCIRNHNLAQNICIKHTTQSQENIKKELKNLLRLNPIANRLRTIQKHLESRYAIALLIKEPITASALKIKILAVKQKRILLHIKQKIILNNTVKIVNTHFYSFKKQLKQLHPKYIIKKHYQPIPLAVIKKSATKIAPAYYTKSNFSTHQNISFSWKMPLYTALPKWIKNIFFEDSLSAYSCSATLKKINNTYKTTLI